MKIRILDKCTKCRGEAYVALGKTLDYQGREYTRYVACANCEGTGLAGRWVDLKEFISLVKLTQCVEEQIPDLVDAHSSAGAETEDIHEMRTIN